MDMLVLITVACVIFGVWVVVVVIGLNPKP